jgi:hypothetical protein
VLDRNIGEYAEYSMMGSKLTSGGGTRGAASVPDITEKRNRKATTASLMMDWIA